MYSNVELWAKSHTTRLARGRSCSLVSNSQSHTEDLAERDIKVDALNDHILKSETEVLVRMDICAGMMVPHLSPSLAHHHRVPENSYLCITHRHGQISHQCPQYEQMLSSVRLCSKKVSPMTIHIPSLDFLFASITEPTVNRMFLSECASLPVNRRPAINHPTSSTWGGLSEFCAA